ncbi:putative bromo domain and PHD finger-containing protein 3 [Mycena kentingensis (nom. inval.)]|nr:putative bromo domain and PHD finger-containing protein 3 [Mycena kentingensis (nom. inval.)]
MARGGHASPAVAPPLLPTASFQRIENDISTEPSGVPDKQAGSFGYNNFSEYTRPDQYIRHIEPLEVDLERQVEYDMDEQDQEWLDAVNTERKKEQMDRVTYEVFEVIVDRLEKEWFNLSKHIPKTDLGLPSEDSTCAICDDAEGENSNAIVFCDGCNLAVHQDCYGVPYIPEGQWLCRKCTVSPENPVSCMLCPNEGGAFKQTPQGDWAHLLCAIWVPETRVSNDTFMEPIIGVHQIVKQRWKLKCSICGLKMGACIQCGKQSCFLAFHVTCARMHKLLLPMKSTQGGEPASLTAYCENHLPKEQAAIRDAALAAEELQAEDENYKAKQVKAARAYTKEYKAGPPLVPQIILSRIQQYVSRVTIRKKQEFLAMVCRYWSLKREARRGAPLLKRLHLEPWTASTNVKMDGEEERSMMLDQLQHLRADLEMLKGLTELTRKRETRKLKQAEVVNNVIAQALFPHVPRLRGAFDRIQTLDRSEYFKNAVDGKEVPDYYDVIKNPICWNDIEQKLDACKYWDLQEFIDDVRLVLSNALLYNQPGSLYHRNALRIQTATVPILNDLLRLTERPNLRITPQEGEEAKPWTAGTIGDLEPPVEVLELLLSSEAIQGDLDMVLDADPITALFKYELIADKEEPVLQTPGEGDDTPAPDAEAEAELENIAEAVNAAEAEKQRKKMEQRLREKERKREKTLLEKQRREISRLKQKEKRAQVKAEKAAAAAAAEAAAAEAAGMATPDASSTADMTREIMSAPRMTRGASLAQQEVEREDSLSAPANPDPQVPSEPQAPTSPLTRRESGPLPRRGEIPLLDDVSQRDTFNQNLFDSGWILPPGQRRTRQSLAPIATSASVGPPPRKRQRIDAGPSRMSTFSAASDNMTLGENAMDVDVPRSQKGKGTSKSSGKRRLDASETFERVDIPPPNIIRTDDGEVIVEELDTPAIRREKSMRRKEERLAAAAAEAGVSSNRSTALSSAPASPFDGPLTPGSDGDSDSSALTEPDDEDGPTAEDAIAPMDGVEQDLGAENDGGMDVDPDGGTVDEDADAEGEEDNDGEPEPDGDGKAEEPAATSPTTGSRKSAKAFKDLGAIHLTGKQRIPPGTLVWAKIASYPWWPAKVFADDDSAIPPKVLAQAEGDRQKGANKGKAMFIVQFFGTQSTWWQCLLASSLLLLGRSKALDEELIASRSSLQKWGKSKSKSDKRSCEQAYHAAMEEMQSNGVAYV